MKLFGRMHAMALRDESGTQKHPPNKYVPIEMRKAFYHFMDKSKYLTKPEGGYPDNFLYELNTPEMKAAAEKWKETVRKDQHALLSEKPELAADARILANLDDGIAGKVTLTELQKKKNTPPPA